MQIYHQRQEENDFIATVGELLINSHIIVKDNVLYTYIYCLICSRLKAQSKRLSGQKK